MISGETITVRIESIAFGGDGVARPDSMVLFVPGTLPGEVVEVRVTQVKKNYARAQLTGIVTASPDRIEPECPLYGKCVNCGMLHMNWACENKIKDAQMLEQLRRLCDEKTEHLPFFAPSNRFQSRNKISLHSDGDGHLGYIGSDNRGVIPVRQCLLALPQINALLAEILDDPTRCGAFKRGQKVNFRCANEPDGARALTYLDRTRSGTLQEKTPFGTMVVPKAGFFQVNSEAMEQLIQDVLAILTQVRPRRFFDLYAGSGLFAAAAAASGLVAEVTAVESDENSVRAARANLARFEQVSAKVFAGDSAQYLAGRGRSDIGRDDLLLVDPPRTGLLPEAVAGIVGSRAKNLCCVSCNVSTLNRDGAMLAEGGFRLRKCRMVNMFPGTVQFECFTFWSRE
ncbi:MAG: TRAM domain-containing protein [Victivallaceae bacterium]|nr:TRAM domain-containing protein [Victivallaceae bacterium]